ncbi:DUF1800 domain-containing protein [Pseudooctadecabacter jejudonensis]|uniref:DUF1800 domain-containing protein n=1 Tax=Pseudooctadecabacter jejudonensis TaxID=1391910 RepID=A0A1Y5SLP5_9RHOB|nr:DUF1800 domain-containing protein [Pseudooctadecabacter jejudonensis]SLN43490.1 hypothetical protein PSJ8397_02232 [Pseudooctadecabacter jejudonensis]
MSFDPTRAAIRFGNGLSPTVTPPVSVADMMARVTGPDVAAAAHPIPHFDDMYPTQWDFRLAGGAVADAQTDAEREAAEEARREMRAAAGDLWALNTMRQLARDVTTEDGFRERLVRFWADHFTAPPTNGQWRYQVYPTIEQRIRPYIAGPFRDMLRAAVTNPMLIQFLSQSGSMGPNSPFGVRRGRGLNENMAREVLELHTLGVGGRYTQDDVRQFAELLTGLTYSARRGFQYDARRAEPGAETVLGRSYGGGEATLDQVLAALDDLALHPDTAHHLARKLAVHFIAPDPDPDLVGAMAAAYLAEGGQLAALYQAMLQHEAAWATPARRVKRPYGFVAASLRALAVPPDELTGYSYGDVARGVFRPLTAMGQTIHQPPGPDGWPEEDEAWITPQGMAGRITWAMQMPERLLDRLPDPRDFVFTALGPTPPEAVLFAANAAETVPDGIGLVLASSAFQRR